jgi:hypothetical protein
MRKQGIRALLILGVLGVLAFLASGPRPSHADDDSSASIIGSWRGTRRTPGSSMERHNLISFLPGGSVVEAAPSIYATGLSFANGTFVESTFIGTWVSEGHGNFVAHVIANIQDAPVSKGTLIGTENLTFRFHIENGKTGGKELKGTLEGVFLDVEGKTLNQLPAGLTWEAVPLTITSNGYN